MRHDRKCQGTIRAAMGVFIASLVLASCAARVAGTLPPRARSLEEIRAGRPVPPGGLLAGVAVRDLTPRDRDVFIAGFGFNRTSAGVRDPVTARVLYLDDGATPVVFVSLDLVGVFLTDCDRIRKAVTRDFAKNIVIAATHNHEGPDPLGWWGWGIPFLFPVVSGVDEEWMSGLRASVAEAILEAASKAEPARLRFASGAAPADLSVNLRKGGKKDDTVRVMRAEDPATGRGIATVVSYANHPEVLFEENRRLSADYPGALYRELERTDGGVALFFQGASGGMVSPGLPRETPLEQREVAVEMIGGAVASTASAALAGSAGEVVESPKIRLASAEVRLPVENWIFRFVKKIGLIAREDFEESAKTEMTLVRIGPAAFVTIPGEPTPATGARIARALGAAHPFLVCLGYDEFGYILQPEEFDDADFEYEVSMSLGRKTAPLVEEAVDRLVKKLGE